MTCRPDPHGGQASDTRCGRSGGRPGPGGRLRPAGTAPLPLRPRPVGGRGDDLGVVGGGDRLHGGRRRAAECHRASRVGVLAILRQVPVRY